MLLSLALILIIGFSLSGLFNRLKIPGLLGMILTGMLLGPFMLDLIASDILDISAELRQISLIVILTRAGLSIDLEDLRRVGRPAVLMSFVPATLEILAISLLAPLLFPISRIEAVLMGTVVAAVSPAVVVPRMLQLMETGYGKKKRIPHLIMASASVDDIYVIVLFASLLGMALGEDFSLLSLLNVPYAIVLGLLSGIVTGLFLVFLYKKIHMRDTIKVFITLSAAFLLVTLENTLKPHVPLSGLLGVMALGATILRFYANLAMRLLSKFSKVWVGAEIMLFVLLGAAVNIATLGEASLSAVLLVLGALVFRILGVYASLLRTSLNFKERLFCALAYLPKATVQAAIGGIPLSLGIGGGELILTVAVLSIMISAPLGAIAIDRGYPLLLKKD
ncbi:MAG: potassium transporter [delta proteobacterium ML8_F1]|nr:MAG: potassium transporter [delta proteobacterium ML8_F1]